MELPTVGRWGARSPSPAWFLTRRFKTSYRSAAWSRRYPEDESDEEGVVVFAAAPLGVSPRWGDPWDPQDRV